MVYIDLTTGKTYTEPTEKYAQRFLGGRGINQWLLYENMKPGADPFDPEVMIAFGSGVLCGTLAPTSARMSIVSKNAWTKGLAHGSVGGKFGPELKFAGFDHLVVKGRAEKPVYIWIEDSDVRIMDARDVWGKTTWEADDYIKDTHGKNVQTGLIGQAGENIVKSAAIIFNRSRALGRCGTAAIMGSKNLKGLVVRGTGTINVSHPDKFSELVDKCWKEIEKSPFTEIMRKDGTNCFAPLMNQNCLVQVRNFQDMYFPPERLKKLLEGYGDGERFEVGKVACESCPIYCSHFYRISEGHFKGLQCEGFEVNVPYEFGTKFDVDYAPWLLQAHALCSQYGLDVDNSSSTISWAFECFEKGLLTENDVDGLKLEWGNYEAIEELLKKITFKKGFGSLLGEGCLEAAKKLGKGSEKFAMHIKGQPLFEPLRVAKGWSLGSVVASRGGGHLDGAPCCEMMIPQIPPDVCESVYGVSTAGDPMTYEGKARLVVFHERMKIAIDCMGICYLATAWSGQFMPKIEEYTELLNAAIGSNFTCSQIMEIGDRVNNVGKAFNTLNSQLFTRKDDYPVSRFFDEPIKSGPRKGAVLEREKWDRMLDEYYQEQGWKKENGLQKEETLLRLGLEEIAEDLKKSGFL
jgi:aldehyde:ferredoxin oxidoreductase